VSCWILGAYPSKTKTAIFGSSKTPIGSSILAHSTRSLFERSDYSDRLLGVDPIPKKIFYR
jgi:hypothetical protein